MNYSFTDVQDLENSKQNKIWDIYVVFIRTYFRVVIFCEQLWYLQ